MDRHLFLKKTTEYWTVWYINEGFRLYWGTHPSIDYCARMVVAYIHRYNVVQNPVFKSGVIPGLAYLVRQQRPSGAYVQWHWRPGRNRPNLDDELSEGNLENSYSATEAIRAMVEGHAFLLRYSPGDTALMSRLRGAVRKGGEFLLQHDDASYPRNYVGFSVWGLASAYRLARDARFRDRAAEKFRAELCSYQDENGAWFNGKETARDYHDAHPCYAGIIIRGMAELHSILSPSDAGPLRDTLRSAITRSINHFLRSGMDKGKGVRLKSNGMLAPYGKETEYVQGPYLASTLVDGLYYALKGDGILVSKTDRDNARKFLNALVRAHVADTMNRFLQDPNVDSNIELLALYGDL